MTTLVGASTFTDAAPNTAKPPVMRGGAPDGFALSPIRAVFLDGRRRVCRTGSEGRFLLHLRPHTLRPGKGGTPVRPTKIYRLHDGFFAASCCGSSEFSTARQKGSPDTLFVEMSGPPAS
jgi:hypothetical protein